jgi:hypothetical protein
MNSTARRAMRATAAFAGLATAFGMTGTALAAPAGTAPSHAPAESALSDGMATPVSPASSQDELHTFSVPSSIRASHRDPHSHDEDNKADNEGDSPEKESGAEKYMDDDSPGYETDRNSNGELKDTEANHKYGAAKCHHSDSNASEVDGYGFDGNRHSGKPDSDDYHPSCTGYHAPRGANQYDNDGYVGTDPSRSSGNGIL